jgi:hypothetical protein
MLAGTYLTAYINKIMFKEDKREGITTSFLNSILGISFSNKGSIKRLANKNLKNVKDMGGKVLRPIFIAGTMAPPKKAAMITRYRGKYLFLVMVHPKKHRQENHHE